MNNSPSFFSDPKVIISILALLISIASLIWTLANQWEQNRRWEQLNNANLNLKEVRMINWKEVTSGEAHNTNWGYKPLIYAKEEATDRYVLPFCLIARDSTQKKIEGVNVIYTISELEEELKRVAYPKGNVNVTQMFRPKFVFENMGKTEAKNISINIDARLPNEEWQNAFTSNTKIHLAGGQSSTTYLDFELPLNSFPSQISFKITLQFQDVNNRFIKKEISTKWTTNDNFWSYESL